MKISIIGAGNLAYHLANFISNSIDLQLCQIYNRSGFSKEFDKVNTDKITNINILNTQSDLYIICIKDDAIAEISSLLPFENKLVVHTSGNTDIKHIHSKNRRGVLYPVQTFSKEKDVNFSEIPFCIEAEKETDWIKLENLAKYFSKKTYKINSLQRKYLHISAVFLNNFSNHMGYLSQKLCAEQQIPFEILNPLFNETYQKIKNVSFYQAQTGPAKRKDYLTIENHLTLLEGNLKKIYSTVTNSILNTYE